MTLKNGFGKCSFCFISQWMERKKHGLFVFPPKKTLIWRRHCSLDQSCCSMTSKQFLESSSDMKFVYPSVRLANQNPGAFVSVRYTNQIALFPSVCCFCFVRAFSFQGHTKIALSNRRGRPRKGWRGRPIGTEKLISAGSVEEIN